MNNTKNAVPASAERCGEVPAQADKPLYISFSAAYNAWLRRRGFVAEADQRDKFTRARNKRWGWGRGPEKKVVDDPKAVKQVDGAQNGKVPFPTTKAC